MHEKHTPRSAEELERAREIKWVNEHYTNDEERELAHILFEAKLLGIGDQLPDHLLPQTHAVKKLFHVPNIDIARRIVANGCDIDSSFESGVSSTDIAVDHVEVLSKIVRRILEERVTPVTEEAVKLVIKRTLKLTESEGGFFIDHLINVVDERVQIMTNMHGSDFIINPETLTAEIPPKPTTT